MIPETQFFVLIQDKGRAAQRGRPEYRYPVVYTQVIFAVFFDPARDLRPGDGWSMICQYDPERHDVPGKRRSDR